MRSLLSLLKSLPLLASSNGLLRLHQMAWKFGRIARGAVDTNWFYLREDSPLRKLGIDFLKDGIIGVIDIDGEAVELAINNCLGKAIVFRLADSRVAEIEILAPNRFDVRLSDGQIESFRFDVPTGQYLVHKSFRTVRRDNLSGSDLQFGKKAILTVDGQKLSAHSTWSVSLCNGGTLHCGGAGFLSTSGMGYSSSSFLFDADTDCWDELFTAQRDWSFGHVLNGESSQSTTLFDSITLFESGHFDFCGKEGYPRFSEVDSIHQDPTGPGFLYVQRDQGSDVLRVYEDQFQRPNGICRYEPLSILGKDGETRYNGWSYAASRHALPLPFAGINPLGTLVLFVVFIAIALALLSSWIAQALACGLALLSSLYFLRRFSHFFLPAKEFPLNDS